MHALQGAQLAAFPDESGDAHALTAAQQNKQPAPASGALSDADVHRILGHRRAYIKQQRAFDRACVGNDQATFDPTLVMPANKLS